MREAAVPGYTLSKARGSSKILMTLALFGLLLGLLTAAVLHASRTGLSSQRIRTYYLGAPQQPAVESAELELLLAPAAARPFEELLETTHIHVTGGSILLFLLCHMLSVCKIPDGLRSGIYCSAFISFLGVFGLPWLIVYGHPGFARLFAPAFAAFLASLLALCVLPLYEMWLRPFSAAWPKERSRRVRRGLAA